MHITPRAQTLEDEDDCVSPYGALTLLERLPELPSDDLDGLLKRLYAAIRTSSGTPQKTRRGRLRDLDEILVAEIRSAFPLDQPISVHDMAASSGITSMDLFERLSRERANVSVYASDFFDVLYVVSPPQSPWKVVFNSTLAPVQFVGRRLVIPANPKPKHSLSRLFLRQPKAEVAQLLLRPWLRARRLARAFEILARALHGPTGGEADEARRHVKRISLFDPRCRALAQADARFTLGHEDFFIPSSAPYHVIRLMNALGPQSRDSQVNKALSAIHLSLLDAGLFVVGNGGEERVRATFFRRSMSGFIAVKDMNNGSGLRSMIESFRAAENVS